MNIRKHTTMAIFAALLATNSAPWIPMALANPVVPAQGALGPKTEAARNGMTVVNINIRLMIKGYPITNMMHLM